VQTVGDGRFSYGPEPDLSLERYNLKYTEDGTTIYWLLPGDRVREFCIKCVREFGDSTCPKKLRHLKRTGCCQSYSCVEVIDAKYVPKGTRGYVESSVLQDEGVPPSVRASLRRIVKAVFFI
jgi:hypothetical protein